MNGDALSGALATTASSTANVGTYGITQGTLAASGNYAVTFAGNQIAIARRSLTISAQSELVFVGSPLPSLAFNLGGQGLVNGDTLSGGLVTNASSNSAPGEYAITQGSLAASSNYALTFFGAELTFSLRSVNPYYASRVARSASCDVSVQPEPSGAHEVLRQQRVDVFVGPKRQRCAPGSW